MEMVRVYGQLAATQACVCSYTYLPHQIAYVSLPLDGISARVEQIGRGLNNLFLHAPFALYFGIHVIQMYQLTINCLIDVIAVTESLVCVMNTLTLVLVLARTGALGPSIGL